ncbi:hypothetical protein CO669_33460 [Bradyrhizobium sp. Y36]|uniref:hypothetical protein n=1 Tax=Bradyrhizobium sp. Y36 TaxID=2035447 RepID=UPI000BE9E1FE|nr:hypothetical protein [Bradyrhizobium sp. Y36]PDT83338.1 hypothetical protein CO669_33460 [Bradyrhizobium sp. Y36]
MPDDAIGFQHDVITPSIDLALEHVYVVATLLPACGHELPKQKVKERLLPDAGGTGVKRNGIVIQFG